MSSENIGSWILFLIRYKDDTTKEQRRKHPRHLAGGDKDIVKVFKYEG
ncbi:MAG: hypothetical protein KHY47_00315 [Prevotella sp.]|nr:hypothetical protein [Prevotella sp.]